MTDIAAVLSEKIGKVSHAGIPTGVHIVFERQGKVLLMRRAGTGFFDGLYSLPGGHVEEGESIHQAASREVQEELGVMVEVDALRWLGVVHRASDTNRIDFFLQAVSWTGVPMIGEPNKCDRLDWFAPQLLPANTVPYIQVALAPRAVPWMLELGWS